MSKVVLNDLNNLQNENSAVALINNNNSTIEQAFDNTLSRNGATPNSMEASLDMNTNRILNLPVPVQSTEPVRLADLDAVISDVGNGNVVGPVSSASGHIPTFLGTSGKLIADSGTSLSDISDDITDLGSLKANRSGDTFTGDINVPNLTATGVITSPSVKLTSSGQNKYLRNDGNIFRVINSANSSYLLSVTEAGQVQATSYTGDGTTLTGLETTTHAAATYSPILRKLVSVGTSTVADLTMNGALILIGSASNLTFGLQPNATIALPIGFQVDLIRTSSGTVQITSAVGVTVGSLSGLRNIASANSSVTLVKVATDTWYLVGSLA